MGIWTSNRNKGYFCVTCYSIDDKKIQKRITNFMHFRTTFRNNISEEFVRNMIAGILKHKYFAFTLEMHLQIKFVLPLFTSIVDKHKPLLILLIEYSHSKGWYDHVSIAAHSTVIEPQCPTMPCEEHTKQASDFGLDKFIKEIYESTNEDPPVP